MAMSFSLLFRWVLLNVLLWCAESALVGPAAARASLAALAEAHAAGLLAEGEEAAACAESVAQPTTSFKLIDASVGRFLDATRSAVQHLLASGILTAKERRQADAIDAFAGLVLEVQSEEPLFWWHGPKRHMRQLLLRLFDTGGPQDHPSARQRLRALAAEDPSSGPQPAGLSPELAQDGRPSLPLSSILPRAGLALGPVELAAWPDAADALKGVARKVWPQPFHLLLLPFPRQALHRLNAAVCGLKEENVYLSALSSAAGGAGDLEAQVRDFLSASCRDRVDLLWIPSGRGDGDAWTRLAPTVAELIRSGRVGAAGIFGLARGAQASLDLLNRKPRPSAWLAYSDLLRPLDADALQAAAGLGVAAVALPRAPPGAIEGALLVSGLPLSPRPADVGAALLHWNLEKGVWAALLRAGREQDPEELGSAVRQALVSAQLSSSFSSFAAGAPPVPVFPAAAEGLDPSTSAKVSASPGIRLSLLENLDEQAEEFRRNKYIVAAPDFFNEETYAAIAAEVRRLWASDEVEANCNLDGYDRLGGYVVDSHGRNGSLYELIYGNVDLFRWASAVNGHDVLYPSDFPIEIREYTDESQGMPCHQDLRLYTTAARDLEFCFTVDNDSACNTSFVDASGVWHSLRTRGNTLMMLRPEASTHCVSTTAGGFRTVIKFIGVGSYEKDRMFWTYANNRCVANHGSKVALAARYKERKEALKRSEL